MRLLPTIATASQQAISTSVQLADATALDPAATSFEAQVDPVQAAVLVGTAIIPFAYWWYITVPEARLALAKDKRLEGGEAREYLLDLAEDDASRPVERWFFAKWLSAAKPRRASEATATAATVTEASVAEEEAVAPTEPSLQELFTPASLKNNATPDFWSFDNPIVVTMSALFTFGVIAAAARENGALTFDAMLLLAGLAFGANRLTLK